MTAEKIPLSVIEERTIGTIEREHLANKGRVDITPEGGEFTDVRLDAPVESNDWSRVFRIFQLNPDEFEVVEDTVRMSTWQQSKRTEGGNRDLVQLYSYSARFKCKPKERITDAEVEKRRAEIRKWKIPTKKRGKAFTGRAGVGAVINLADIQGGKSEGGGVQATQQRLQDGLVNVDAWLNQMWQTYDIDELVIVNNGDPLENCAGNYASQLFTVELNHRGQANFVLDVWEQYARHLFPQYDKARFVSVLCNHGEMGRLGQAKALTGDSDNWGGLLAETLQRTLAGRPEFDHVQWTIPHDEMTVYADVAGIPMGFNHGHKIPSNDATGFEKWLNGQVRGDENAHRVKVWQTAHRHSYQTFDLGSCFVHQSPSLDGGSKWLKDMTGKYSRSGILAYVVGNHSPLGVSDWAFL